MPHSTFWKLLNRIAAKLPCHVWCICNAFMFALGLDSFAQMLPWKQFFLLDLNQVSHVSVQCHTFLDGFGLTEISRISVFNVSFWFARCNFKSIPIRRIVFHSLSERDFSSGRPSSLCASSLSIHSLSRPAHTQPKHPIFVWVTLE